jgi:hypothetical protein
MWHAVIDGGGRSGVGEESNSEDVRNIFAVSSCDLFVYFICIDFLTSLRVSSRRAKTASSDALRS